ncbi:efflux pump atB-like [Teratosphaeria destructans]|uniref:Efflux pump atB-like n=1 Tax=Teratosphaeria destructans TaxID=418781 RepID=A0A9W7SIK9_9PEZI|nr:efflux pump atB-like [Teratosphaeria destructans]
MSAPRTDAADIPPSSREHDIEKAILVAQRGDEADSGTAGTLEPTTTGGGQPDPGLRPVGPICSHSSARSHKSFTDGYWHSDDRDEAANHHKQVRRTPDNASPDPEKEFEVTFDGDADPYSPKNRSRWRKWTIVLILAGSSLCVTCASALYTSTYAQLEVEFHVSREAATVGLTTFVCGLGLGPMFLSPLSEFYGRRIVYLGAFGVFFIWLIPCAVANNIATMLVVRFFDGLAGSAFLSVAGGTVGDMFPKNELSAPMIIYTASPFIGPEVGPVMGGFINQFTNWRWSFWVLVIWAGLMWCLIFFFVPETYGPVLLRRKAVKLREDTGDDRWQAPIERMNKSVTRTVLWSCIRPFQLLTFEPMCLNLCLLSAILLGIIYLFFGVGAFALVFENNHGFNQWQIGLSFLGIFVGMLVGVSLDPIWRRNYDRLVRNNGGVSEPEFRLPPTILGAMLVPVSLFGFGWTTFSWVHWIVPSMFPDYCKACKGDHCRRDHADESAVIFSGLFGLGNILCFGGVSLCPLSDEAQRLTKASSKGIHLFG